MAKEFNITGTCVPSKHYMADVSAKLKPALALIEKGKYFIIHRPRQYGKTTMLSMLNRALAADPAYISILTSFEGVGDAVFKDEASFCKMFLGLLENRVGQQGLSALATFLSEEEKRVTQFKELAAVISGLVKQSGKKVVVLIDEVDKSSNNQLFISFLAMLRTKYLDAQLDLDATFHSVILAGLHDVKTLKAKLRPDDEAKYNSPWNIAADFDVDMSLFPNEIVPMLEDYAQEQQVNMDAPPIAERLFYYTSGYPFLVSALCKIVDEKILPTKSERIWDVQDIELAADRLIKSERSNANFDTVIKNLENNQRLYDLVFRLIIENEPMLYNVHEPIIYFGILNGIFRNGEGLNIHNRIYREVIGNYMAAKLSTSGRALVGQNSAPYTMPDNGLNIEKILRKFQEYMREEYSKKDRDFLERNGRLVFLAFLKPIINGRGYAFKEPEISEERRMDIAITFNNSKYMVELKIWRGEAAHQNGLGQLSDYLNRQQLKEGYLVIFDHSTTKSWKNGWLDVEGKKVFAVWV